MYTQYILHSFIYVFYIICTHYNIRFVLSQFVYKASLKHNVLLVYNPKPKSICICKHSAIYVFGLNHNIYCVLTNFVYKAVPQKCMFVLVYNLTSKSFCIQRSILYVLCLICLNQNIYFVLLKFENNIACTNTIYFHVYKY